MAMVVVLQAPGVTVEQFEAVAKVTGSADNLPAGNVARLAGPVEGGWRVIAVWESPEAFDAFRRERLEPALRQAGGPMPRVEVAPLHSVLIAPQQR